MLLRRLLEAHGPVAPPARREPLDELILTILSQNTSDTNRDRAWSSLRSRFPTWEQVADAPASAVEDAIRPGGLAATKAPRIQAVLRAVRERWGGLDLAGLSGLDDREARGLLEALPGVGPKTAACVLAFSLGRPALPVDTHVHRLAVRLGLIPPGTGPAAAHDALERLVAPHERLPLHVALVRHGRVVCRATRPRCDACVLADLCPRVGVRPPAGRRGSPRPAVAT